MSQTSSRSAGRFVTLALALTLALAMVGGCRTKKAGIRTEAPVADISAVTVLQQVQGDEPALKMPGAVIIQSQEQLTRLNASELTKIKVDFDKQSLIVLSLGRQSTSGYWTKINAMQLQGDLLYVQATANKPAVDAKVERKAHYPFAAVVVAKVKAVKPMPEVESVMGQSPAAVK